MSGSSFPVKVDTYFLSAGYRYTAPSTYAEDTASRAMSTGDAGATVTTLEVNGGVAPTAGAWYPVTLVLTNASTETADIKVDWNGSSVW